jgi:SNF2 family DNA or RNA helicase
MKKVYISFLYRKIQSFSSGIWGSHLIIVPINVMINWELEFKKWCPALKILTYYGTIKERQDWTESNEFHICITSYKFILQDVKLFRRKKWKYLIIDEVQSIESWELLSNFHSQHRLLLTSIPLQNSLTELCQFLMPNLSSLPQQFSNPSTEINEQEQIEINDINKILHPFILRRLKTDVDDQMPKKYEHIIMCYLSKRQKELYNKFLQSKSTQDIIKQGNYTSIMNILMQLKKVCNHPDLFQIRSILSPFIFNNELIKYKIPKLIDEINFKNPYLKFDYSSNDTFLSYRIQFTLQATKDMIMDRINQKKNFFSNRQKIQLTTDIIQRYRNSSLWFQTNKINLQNHSEIKQIDINDDDDDDEFQPENIYHEIRKQREEERLSRYELFCQINSERCQSHPLYGSDTLSQIQLAMSPCHYLNRTTFSGYTLCQQAHQILNTTRSYFTTTDILRSLIKSNRERFDEYQDLFNR